MGFGAAVLLPLRLVHPLTVCVTEKVPADPVMEVVVAPVFQSNVPVKLLAVSSEEPQLLETPTVGADGIVWGDAVLLPVGLTHPFEILVCVTE